MKVAANETTVVALEVMNGACTRLWALGYQVLKPENLGGRHVEALVKDWHASGLSPKTIQNRRSQLKKFFLWLGKKDIVKQAHEYIHGTTAKDFVVQTTALKSKAPSANGVDVVRIIGLAHTESYRLGDMLRMELAFGVRSIEALQLKPWMDDHGSYLNIRPGIGKGGRPRHIPIKTAFQRAILDSVKSRYKKGEHLGWTDVPQGGTDLLKRNKGRYAYLMGKIGMTKKGLGVTGHGLRAEFAENLALRSGLIPATLGGQDGQMSAEDRDMILGHVSEALGHSEKRAIAIGRAYLGALPRQAQTGVGPSI